MPGLSSSSSSTAILAMAGSAALIAGLRYLTSSSVYLYDLEDDEDDDVDITAEIVCDVYSLLNLELETIYFDLVTNIQTHLSEWQQRVCHSSDSTKENKCNDDYDMLTPQQITDAVRVELFHRVGSNDDRIHQILRHHYPMIQDVRSFHHAVEDHLSMGNVEVYQALTLIRTFWEKTRSTRHWNKLVVPVSKTSKVDSTTCANAA